MKTPSVSPLLDRLHGLDALRGIALLLGLVVHASMSYLPGAQYFWVTHDPNPNALPGLAFYVPHMFRMLLFFLLAGFFGRMLLQRVGVRGFAKDRLKRIGGPLLIGWPLVLTAIVAVLAWNAVLVHGALPQEPAPGPKFTPDDFPLTHLWFLYSLLLCYTVALIMRLLGHVLDRKGRVASLIDRLVRLLAGRSGPFLLALPLSLALTLTAKWHAWFGIPTPDQSLYPNLAACVGFGTAFAFGWLLQRQPELLRGWAQRWTLHLGLALAATIACLTMIGLTPKLAPAGQDFETWSYALLYAFAAWNWCLGLSGFALAHCATCSPARRYLADASYWIYLAHLPVVMALQVAASRVEAPAWIELPAILGLTFALLIVSYHVGVRRSFIGALLNGKRRIAASDAQPVTLGAAQS